MIFFQKSFVAVLALVALAAADVSHLVKSAEAGAETVREATDVRPNGYDFGFETSNGIIVQESAGLKNVGSEQEAIQVQGANSYISPEGESISLTFTADENGYHPQGAHLPTPPAPQPIPDYILRSLEYNAKHLPAPEVYNKKF